MFVFRIEVYTSALLISASYQLTLYRRLSDALNDSPGEFLTLTNAIISPLQRPQQAQRVSKLLVERSNILLVTALHEPDPPDDFMPSAQPTNREGVPMMFFTAAFALQATFYKRPDHSLIEMLEQHGEDFIPVKEVRVIPLHHPRSIVRDFACLNRAYLQACYANEWAEPAEPDANAPPPPPPAAEDESATP